MSKKEIIQFLSSELDNESISISEGLTALEVTEISNANKTVIVEHILGRITYLSEALIIAEFTEFTDLYTFYFDNIKQITTINEDSKLLDLISISILWLESLKNYFKNPSDSELLGKVIFQAQNNKWILPLAQQKSDEIAERLIAFMMNDEQNTREVEKSDSIGTNNLSLTFSDDVNLRLIEAFYIEVPDQLNRFSELIQEMTTGTSNQEKIAEAQRIAHTLKGTSNIVGLTSAATLTHLMEDIFEYIVVHKKTVSQQMGELLVSSCDHLEEIVASLTGTEQAPNNTNEILLELNKWQSLLDGDIEATSKNNHQFTTKIPTQKAENKNSADKKSKKFSPEEYIRIPAKSMETMTGLAGEMSTALVQFEDIMENTVKHLKLLERQNDIVENRLNELQDLIQLKNTETQENLNKEDLLDPLEMEKYNELHSTTNSLAETVRDITKFTKTIRSSYDTLTEKRFQLENLGLSINNTLIQTRLAPVETISSRLKRGVRQVAKATNKKVNLTITGSEILIDNQILNNIVDPLLHILRNAIDHGLEKTSKRKAFNKSETGKINLNFTRQGESILITCKDDGKGFNIDNIRKKAISSGMLGKDTELTDKELLSLSLLAGFTTKDDVSQISGRGIGMDVVNKAIVDLRGSIEIESSQGVGSTITLRIPLTLISMHIILFRLNDSIYATPSSGLEQVLFSDAGQIIATKTGHDFILDEQTYEILKLSDMFGLPTKMETGYTKAVSLFLINNMGRLIAIEFDEALNGKNMVVNRFNDYTPRLSGIVGASIMGDGSVAPVIDLIDLLNNPIKDSQRSKLLTMNITASKTNLILVVDDSISARSSMVGTLENAGFETMTALDGLDALLAIEKKMPDALIIDLEMPRMNGLELAKRIKSNDNLKHLPLIMVTSRTTDKHRKLSKKAQIEAYYTKPFQEDVLIEKIYQLIETSQY